MRRLMLLTVLSLAVGAVHAENGSFYVDAGVSHSDVSNNDFFDTADQKATSWKAFVGFRPIKAFAIEADYIDLGSSNITFTQQPPGPFCPAPCTGSEHAGGSEYAGYWLDSYRFRCLWWTSTARRGCHTGS